MSKSLCTECLIKSRVRSGRWRKNKRSSDFEYRAEMAVRNMVRKALEGYRDSSEVCKIIGLSYSEFMAYMESLFWPGMAWENYGAGRDKWNIDHKIPLSSVDTIEEKVLLCNYNNLQPLWQDDNMWIKSARLDWSPLESNHELPEYLKGVTNG